MRKIFPDSGQPPQPRRTYYYEMLLLDMFRRGNWCISRPHVYSFYKTVAEEKGSDHMILYLQYCVQNFIYIRAKYQKIYLHSVPYFKCTYNVGWAAELVKKGQFRRVELSFMAPGHTKVKHKSLFRPIANKFFNRDVFNRSQLLDGLTECAECPFDVSCRYLVVVVATRLQVYQLQNITETNCFNLEPCFDWIEVDGTPVRFVQIVQLHAKHSSTGQRMASHTTRIYQKSVITLLWGARHSRWCETGTWLVCRAGWLAISIMRPEAWPHSPNVRVLHSTG